MTPKASLAGISGLDALVGGNYIGMMPGKGNEQTHFTALDTQPKYRVNTGELLVHLQADNLGSLSTGSLVYFRKLPVGKVYDFDIARNRKGVNIDVLIDRRFTHLVKKDSRFWNVFDLKANVDLHGARVEMESVAALVNDSIAFDSPANSAQASTDDNYQFYPDLAHSQRGVIITLDLPDGSHLSAGHTPLLYQGLEVGMLTKITLGKDRHVTGELTLNPSVADLMRSGTLIVMTTLQLSLTQPDFSGLLAGTTLELIPGEGEPQQRFTVPDSNRNLLQLPGVKIFTLSALQSYGIDAGQPLTMKGIQVGKIIARQLTGDRIVFSAAVKPEFADVIHQDTKFVVNSRVDVKFGLDGVRVLGTSAQEWLDGGVEVIPGAQGPAQSHYPLYGNREMAEQGIQGDRPNATLTLTASDLPDIQTGSIVLYRKFQVGEIVDVWPTPQDFKVDVYIQPKYRNLLSDKSVFWAEGGARVQINGSGLTVQASPLNRTLKGAVSFDNLAGASVVKGAPRKLYGSENATRAVGSQIVLRTYYASKLSPGNNLVLAQAVLYPEYVQTFARNGTRFSVVTPEISAAGVNHLETLLQPYINVEPGKGAAAREFELQQTTITDSRYLNGLNIVVDTPEAGSLQVGTPVLYRGIEVGTVTDLTLGALTDRVYVALRISRQYQHLVRTNSVFWLASGYDIKFGLTGGSVKSGTFQQFVRGGIAFATPPPPPLAPKATEGRHFLLYSEEQKEWKSWGTAVPPN